MRNLRVAGSLFAGMFLLGMIVLQAVGCKSEGQAGPETTDAADSTVVLTIISGTQMRTYTLKDLKAMTPVSGFAGTKSKAGAIFAPVPYKGVPLSDLLSPLGGVPAGGSIRITARDGYTKTLTYDQIGQADFASYDLSGNTATPEANLTLFLAYEADGKALDSNTGPVQLAVMTSKNQVTDGSNFVRMVEKVEIVGP
jgi:hypothetical protein